MVMTVRQTARAVIQRALANELKIDDFHNVWPSSTDPLIRAIAEETEDSIEHAPAPLLRSRSSEVFEESVLYKTMVVDAELLADEYARVPSSELLDLRARLFAELDFS